MLAAAKASIFPVVIAALILYTGICVYACVCVCVCDAFALNPLDFSLK